MLWATPSDTRGTFVEELSQANFDKAAKEGVVTIDLGWWMITLKDGFFKSLGGSFPLVDIQSYNGSLFVVAGVDDPIASGSARQFIGQSNCIYGGVSVIPGGGHIYQVLTESQGMAEMVLARTTDWFKHTQ